jgi:hypothetical protein
MKIVLPSDIAGLSEGEKKQMLNKLLKETFPNFIDAFYSLGCKQKIWGRWTNDITNETFEIEFKKIGPKNEFKL